jgi:TBC1 domain family member 20
LGSLASTAETNIDWKSLPPHRDEEQVKLDVNRSFVYYPSGESEKQLEKRKGELYDLIVETLRRHPAMCYFQGYHDIVQVFLLVLGPERAVPAVARLSLLRIRDYMLPAMSPVMPHLHLLPAILYAVNRLLCKHLAGTHPYFALSATLTMYSHDIQEYGDIARLFDFLLAREAVMTVYLYAAIILARKDELLEIPADDPDMLHFTLSKLPQPLDLENLIEQTSYLFANHPPESLPSRAWRSVSRNSVLKTTRDPTLLSKQTIQEGENWFAKQAKELRRQQAIDAAVKELRTRMWRYRRPAVLTIAVAVGVLAWYMGSKGPIGPNATSALANLSRQFVRTFRRIW